MKKFGLVGEKLGHTFSPTIHKAILKHLDVIGNYGVLEYDKAEVPNIVQRLKKLSYSGVNVTIPYKTDIMRYLDEISVEAMKIGAINTISFLDDKTVGYNTDYFGFGMLLKHNNIDVEEKKALILGTGGASRAVVQYLIDNKIKDVQFASTNVEGSKIKYPNYCVCGYDKLKQLEKMDIVINCTPVGMFNDIDCLDKFGVAVDLIYNPLETTFLRQAKNLGLKTANGLYMLVAQAVKSQEIWNNTNIDNAIIDEINNLLTQELVNG